jgi:hypothetical protein
MALRDPAIEEQKQLGHVIYDLMKSMSGLKQDADFSYLVETLSSIPDRKIEELHKSTIDPEYLVEVKTGMLALGDFLKVLDENDTKDLLHEIDIYSHISEHTKAELLNRMSFSERAQLK